MVYQNGLATRTHLLSCNRVAECLGPGLDWVVSCCLTFHSDSIPFLNKIHRVQREKDSDNNAYKQMELQTAILLFPCLSFPH